MTCTEATISVHTGVIKACSLLDRLINEDKTLEEFVLQLLSQSKTYLRECLNRMDDVKKHVDVLKEAQEKIKFSKGVKMCELNTKLESKIDSNIKTFLWLFKATQYPCLLAKYDVEAVASDCATEYDIDVRIPWETLVKLKDTIPQITESTGDVAFIILRINDLYKDAYLWHQQVSELTTLSPRGGKRRKINNFAKTVFSKLSKNQEHEEINTTTVIDNRTVVDLSCHHILRKVAMPREDAVQSILEKTQAFEKQMHEFLGKDYVGAYPDRAAYPAPRSMIGDQGELIVLRLAYSPLYADLKNCIEQISQTTDEVAVDTPGKATFEWICEAVQWIDSVVETMTYQVLPFSNESCKKATMNLSVAQSLITNGETILLDVPEDLRVILSQHGITVSTNKDGKLTVKLKKGGANFAVGTTAIRWCPVLLDSLKLDVERTLKWEEKVCCFYDKTSKSSHDFSYTKAFSTIELTERKHQLEQINKEGNDTLFVLPSEGTIQMLAKCTSYLEKSLKPFNLLVLQKEFVKNRYLDGNSAVSQRANLLQALVGRKRKCHNESSECVIVAADNNSLSCRNNCRIVLDKSLREGLQNLNIDVSGDTAAVLSATKSLEIEKALFDNFHKNQLNPNLSADYREKAREICRNIKDVGNRILAARVLSGDLVPSMLVRMDASQLANPKVRRLREVALQKINYVLNPPQESSSSSSSSDPSAEEVIALPAPTNDKIEEEKVDKVEDEPSTPPKSDKKEITNLRDSNKKSEIVARLGFDKTNPLLINVNISSYMDDSPKKTKILRPPPSLASSLLLGKDSPEPHRRIILNTEGAKRTTISVSKIQFTATFYLDTDNETMDLDGIFPTKMAEKGRLKIPEFIKFLEEKRQRGRWAVYKVRMIPLAGSKSDEDEYKRYYTQYEEKSKERIAMFNLEGETKVFLVTPKFHHTIKAMNPLSRTSTYAILLKRLLT